MNSKKRRTTSKRLDETIQGMAKALYDIDVIDAITMREFDATCVPKVMPMSARAIKTLRLREKVSQTVFAKFLNTSSSAVRQWEQGDKCPRGTSLKLLNLVHEHGLSILVSSRGAANSGVAGWTE